MLKQNLNPAKGYVKRAYAKINPCKELHQLNSRTGSCTVMYHELIPNERANRMNWMGAPYDTCIDLLLRTMHLNKLPPPPSRRDEYESNGRIAFGKKTISASCKCGAFSFLISFLSPFSLFPLNSRIRLLTADLGMAPEEKKRESTCKLLLYIHSEITTFDYYGRLTTYTIRSLSYFFFFFSSLFSFPFTHFSLSLE